MQQTTHASRLRYLDAADLDDADVDFSRLDVRSSHGERLGDLDGFVVDPESGRVLYTVVDSGGWFSSRRLLVPIGHARVDRDGRALLVEDSREILLRYPEFREQNFRNFSDEEFRSYQRKMTGDEDDQRHYRQPDWWKPGAIRAERLRPIEPRPFRDQRSTAVAAGELRSETADREMVIGRGEDEGPGGESPHWGGRAQPGDVLGIETGGETTRVGDTGADEDERRRTAERAVVDDEPRPDRTGR